MIPNADVTIYNKYVENRAEKYQRVEVRGVVWEATNAVSGAGNGRLASNVATVFIPFARGVAYSSPIVWRDLSAEIRATRWTLQEGDLIARGIVADEITSEFTLSALRAKYDDVVEITSVDCMDQGSANVRHWEVGCK